MTDAWLVIECLFKEPLLHFLAIGVALFLAATGLLLLGWPLSGRG